MNGSINGRQAALNASNDFAAAGLFWQAPAQAVRDTSDTVLTICASVPMTPDGADVLTRDAYGQTKHCLQLVASAAAQAGFSIEDIVRTRVYVKPESDWDEIMRAYDEMFNAIRPARSFIEIDHFEHPDWHLEVEAECSRG